MYDRTYVTLNIGYTSVRLLSVKGNQVKKWGSASLPPGLVKDGLILKPKVVGAVISALFKSTEIPKTRVITSLTGLPFIHRILSLPQTEANAPQEALQRAAKKEMPLPLEELYLCEQAIDSGQDELDFFVLGVPRHPIDALVQTLEEARVQPYRVDLNPLALARVANREDAIIVALEPDCFDIVLVADGLPAIMHTITPRRERATLEDNIRRLVDELAKAVEFYNSNHPQNPLSPDTPLLLTGELLVDTAASEIISAETEYPVELLTSPLELPHDLPAPLFATNIGLALKKLSLKSVTKGKASLFHDINLDILSGKYGVRTRWIRWPHIFLSLAIVAGLGLLLPLDQLRSQADAETNRLQTELTSISQQLNQTLVSVDEAAQIEDTIDEIIADVETIKKEHQSILSRGSDSANNLKLVTDALPPEVDFTFLETGTVQVIIEGEADSSFKVVSYVMALEALGKYSEVRIDWINESKHTGNLTAEMDSSKVSFGIVVSK